MCRLCYFTDERAYGLDIDVKRLFPEHFKEAIRLKIQQQKAEVILLACEAAHQGYSQVER